MPKTQAVALRAVLFTDVVGSTELARELGDERWARLLAAQRRVVREQLRAHHGREIDTAGDGFFAVFDGPTDAVRCAFAAARKVQDLGLDIRAGVHFGEIEMSGKNVHGIVVHTGARVMGNAGPAEVLITQTVKDLVAGARFGVRERDPVELKGVPGAWTLFDVLQVGDELRPEPIEEATVASERREQASSGAARGRRRWVVPAALVAVLALIAALVVALKPSPSHVPTAGTIAEIKNNRFDEPVAVGSFPLGIIEGGGRVWVLDRQSQIYWVDEATGQTGSRGTDGVPTGAVFGGGAVWITAAFGGGGSADATVSRLDPAAGQLTAAFHTPIDSQAIAFGGGSVWVADTNVGTVTRYDTVARKTTTIPLSTGDTVPGPDSIAYSDLGGGTLWVGDSLSNSVFRLDATGPDAIRTYTVGSVPSAVVAARDGIWVMSEPGDAVYELDPSSGAIRNTYDLRAIGCSAPTSLAVTGDGVWIACSLSHQVIRLGSGASGRLSLQVDGVPAALTATADGSVFVAVQPR